MNIIFDIFKTQFKKRAASDENEKTFNDYYLRLTELAINAYEWYNLPDSVDERYLEMTLYTQGCILFFKDPALGLTVAKTAYGGELDIYALPEHRQAYAVNGYNKAFNAKNSVLIFNNRLRIPSMRSIELYARRLADLQRSIDVNVRAQKTPLLIKCSDKNKLTLKNLYAQYNGNEPVIYATKDFDGDPITSIKTDAPYVADRLHLLKRQMWNEAITFIGIESANTEKAERLITDEVTSNLGTAEAQRYTKLNARRDAARKINKMFGTKLDVDFRSNNTILDTTAEGKDKKDEDEETTIDAATYRSYQSNTGETRAFGQNGRND